MRVGYFKSHKRFNFFPHPYDIGNIIGLWQKYEDNHFLKKLNGVDEVKLDEFYKYHLSHILTNNICNEEVFFFKLWGSVEGRIKNLKAKDPFSS